MLLAQAGRLLASAWVVGALLVASAAGVAGDGFAEDHLLISSQEEPLVDPFGNLSVNETGVEEVLDNSSKLAGELGLGANVSFVGDASEQDEQKDSGEARVGSSHENESVLGEEHESLTDSKDGEGPGVGPQSSATSGLSSGGVQPVLDVDVDSSGLLPDHGVELPEPVGQMVQDLDRLERVVHLGLSTPAESGLDEAIPRVLFPEEGDPDSKDDDSAGRVEDVTVDSPDATALLGSFISAPSSGPESSVRGLQSGPGGMGEDEGTLDDDPPVSGDSFEPKATVVDGGGAWIVGLPVALGLGVLASLAVLVWRTEFFLKFLQLLGIRMFSRIREDAVLKNKNRNRIFTIIQQNPGISIQEISDLFDLQYNTVSHHVEFLRRHEKVVSLRDGRKAFIYDADLVSAPEKFERLKALPNPIDQVIVQFLEKSSGATSGEIATALDIPRATVYRRATALVEKGIFVVNRSDNNQMKYYIVPESPGQGFFLVTGLPCSDKKPSKA